MAWVWEHKHGNKVLGFHIDPISNDQLADNINRIKTTMMPATDGSQRFGQKALIYGKLPGYEAFVLGGREPRAEISKFVSICEGGTDQDCSPDFAISGRMPVEAIFRVNDQTSVRVHDFNGRDGDLLGYVNSKDVEFALGKMSENPGICGH